MIGKLFNRNQLPQLTTACNSSLRINQNVHSPASNMFLSVNSSAAELLLIYFIERNISKLDTSPILTHILNTHFYSLNSIVLFLYFLNIKVFILTIWRWFIWAQDTLLIPECIWRWNFEIVYQCQKFRVFIREDKCDNLRKSFKSSLWDFVTDFKQVFSSSPAETLYSIYILKMCL